MTDDFLQVYIEDAGTTLAVGKIHSQSSRGYETATFLYDREWLERDGAYPLAPDMPLSRAPFVSGGRNKTALPAVVRDGSPDRWGRKLILRMRARQNERSRTLTEVDYLLGLDDFTRIGALRYRINGEGAFLGDHPDAPVPPIIAIPKLVNAADAVTRDKETDADLKYLLGFGSPLGGARPKSVVRDADGALAIAKFAKHDDQRSIALGEVLAATIAERAGVSVAPARMLTVAGQQISVIARFDRRPDGGREHFMSAMTLLAAQEGDTETYAAIAEGIRVHGANVLADLEELWRRVVLSVLISNLDDHLRNHGFLHAGNGRWRLSPAYDINPVPREERGPELTTWIDEAGPEASIERVLDVAPQFGLKPDRAMEILERAVDAASQWKQIARQLGGSEADISAYESAFEHDQLGVARRLVATRVPVGSTSPLDP